MHVRDLLLCRCVGLQWPLYLQHFWTLSFVHFVFSCLFWSCLVLSRLVSSRLVFFFLSRRFQSLFLSNGVSRVLLLRKSFPRPFCAYFVPLILCLLFHHDGSLVVNRTRCLGGFVQYCLEILSFRSCRASWVSLNFFVIASMLPCIICVRRSMDSSIYTTLRSDPVFLITYHCYHVGVG